MFVGCAVLLFVSLFLSLIYHCAPSRLLDTTSKTLSDNWRLWIVCSAALMSV